MAVCTLLAYLLFCHKVHAQRDYRRLQSFQSAMSGAWLLCRQPHFMPQPLQPGPGPPLQFAPMPFPGGMPAHMLRPPPGVAPPPGFMMPPGTLQQLPQGTSMPVSMYCSWAACSMTQICLSQTITALLMANLHNRPASSPTMQLLMLYSNSAGPSAALFRSRCMQSSLYLGNC